MQARSDVGGTPLWIGCGAAAAAFSLFCFHLPPQGVERQRAGHPHVILLRQLGTLRRRAALTLFYDGTLRTDSSALENINLR